MTILGIWSFSMPVYLDYLFADLTTICASPYSVTVCNDPVQLQGWNATGSLEPNIH